MSRRVLTSILVCGVVACSGPQEEGHQFPDANDPAYAASFDGYQDPRVSTSPGVEGGVVILWPRLIPSEGAEARSALAGAVQERLREVAGRTLEGRELDVRPDPQRVCPRSGCLAVSLGAVLVHRGEGCAVVATVSRPGESAMRLVPWSSGVQLRSAIVPFRDPPESQISVQDYTPCAALLESLTEQNDAVDEAVNAVTGQL